MEGRDQPVDGYNLGGELAERVKRIECKYIMIWKVNYKRSDHEWFQHFAILYIKYV